MRHLSRRSFLKTVAGLTTTGALALSLPPLIGCRRSYDLRINLNVVLHGLFILDFQDNYIDLLTPYVEEHTYMAGTWDSDLTVPLGKQPRYSLIGTTPAMTAPTPSNCNVVLLRNDYAGIGFQVDAESSYFAVEMPFPTAIHSLRCVDDSSAYKTDCSKCNSTHEVDIYKLSLCQVLVYPVSDYRALKLAGTNWKPRIDPVTRTANLHFWAEPPKRLTPLHADAAYGKLSELLPPLQLRLETDRTAPLDPDTGVLGVSSEELQGLSEWQNAGEGSFPTNCCAVIVR